MTYIRLRRFLKNCLIISVLPGIYSNDLESSTNEINQDFYFGNLESVSGSVIGIIKIEKINIVYPILSEINKSFLKISPCKFYGPNPNQVGNLCIAAHNYKDDSFFSNISSLVNGDIITIYDISGNYIDYIVYHVYTTDSKDLECINQNTNGNRVVTLVTCDSFNNNYRTIVKAKEL